jgi:hypothetical protein
MDETTVRELLHQIAADEAPPCTVDIALARRGGRRHPRSGRLHRLRSGRLHPPWAAPIAAAAAVAVIAALSLAIGFGHRPAVHPSPQRPAHHARPLMTVPRAFSAMEPYVSFGWLPPGFSSSGLAGLNNSQPTGPSVSLQASAPLADGRMLNLLVFASGQCSLTGRERLRVPVRARPTPAAQSQIRTVTYPNGLSCAGPIVRAAAPINGGPAYRGPLGNLYWEYGRGAWAELMPLMNPALVHAHAPAIVHSWLNFPDSLMAERHSGATWHQSAASYQLLRKVASRLRFDPAQVHPLYGFALSGLPASWGTGYTTGLATLNGRVASEGWQAGPTVDNSALSISVWPATRPQGRCNYVAGQTQYVSLDGIQVMLRTIDQSYKHWQELCSMNLAGMQVLIELDLNTPGTNDTPLPGGAEVSSVLTIFRHLRLLGPDVKNWTRQPLR